MKACQGEAMLGNASDEETVGVRQGNAIGTITSWQGCARKGNAIVINWTDIPNN